MGQEQSLSMDEMENASMSDDDDLRSMVFKALTCRHLCLISLKYDLDLFVKKLACEIRQGCIASMRGRIPIMIDLKKFSAKVQYLPSRILLGNMFSNLEDPALIFFYEWMIKNGHKLVFVIYCLDTYPYSLEQKRRSIGYYTRASADVVIHNLFSSILFANSVIISTTGQKKFENMHPLCHPDQYIVIDGLNEQSSFAPFHELIGKHPLQKSKRLTKSVWPQGPQFEEAMEALGVRRNTAPSQTRDIEAKRKALADHMIDALKGETNERRRLELLLTVYEGREASTRIVRSAMTGLDMSDVPIDESECQALSYLVSLARHMRYINFCRCDISDSSLGILASFVQSSHCDGPPGVKIDSLDVSHNDLTLRGISSIRSIIGWGKVKSLNIAGCGIKASHLQKLLQMHGRQVQSLDVSHNHLVGADEMLALGKLIKLWSTKIVTMNNCSLTSNSMRKFLDGCGGAMVESIDLSDWSTYPTFGPVILELLSRVRREITLHGWKISEKDLLSIQEKLNKINSKILVVYLNGGFEMKARTVS